MLAEPRSPRQRTTIQEIHDYVTKNLHLDVSFSTVRNYVRALRQHHDSDPIPNQIR